MFMTEKRVSNVHFQDKNRCKDLTSDNLIYYLNLKEDDENGHENDI